MFKLTVLAVSGTAFTETVSVFPLNPCISPCKVETVLIVVFTVFYQFIILFLSLRPEPPEKRIISPVIHKVFYKSYHFHYLHVSGHNKTALGESG